MLIVNNLDFSHNHVPIFDKVNFTIGDKVKVGLVGKNGAGKTTLFKLLIHELEPLDGKIEVNGTVSMVPQEVKSDSKLEASKNLREYIDPDYKKYDYELNEILAGLENLIDLNHSLINLSGGQRTKLALARALIEEPDILLLDEPTNYLDIPGKMWVMRFLSTYPKTLVLVSHDIELLDKYIDKIIAIDTFTNKIDEYKGNYSDYLRLRGKKEELLEKTVATQKKTLKRMKKSLEKLRLRRSKKGVRQRVVLERRIGRLTDSLPELPPTIKKIKIILPNPEPIGQIALRVKNICKKYDTRIVLDDISFSLQRKQRIALIGPNGAGKSTLIKILLGIIPPDIGEIYKDAHAKIGYYSQEFDSLDFNLTVIDTLRNNTSLSEYEARSMLARFNFMGNQAFQKTQTLSGGEKTRLYIALLLSQPNNILILDEPTTYLDVLSQRIILDSLKQYEGAMLVVSHTEEFISELNPSQALLLPENSLKNWKPELMQRVGII